MTKLTSLIKNLEKANKKLKEAAKFNPSRMNKDATVQRFEFTFELAWKTIREYLIDQGIRNCNSPKSCIREAARLDVIDNPEEWIEYLKSRNFTVHAYNEEIADEVYRKAVEFPKEIDKLLKNIDENL